MSNASANGIKEAFRKYDMNGDGWVSFAELRDVFKRLDADVTDGELDSVFARMDANHDRKIQYDEFVDWLCDDAVSWTDVCNCKEQGAGELQAAVREDVANTSLEPGLHAVDEVGVGDLPEKLQFNGEEPDFLELVRGLRQLNARQLRDVFINADIDKSGFLQLPELRRVLFPEVGDGSEKGPALAAITKLFAQLDKNQDGKVQCGEFVSQILSFKLRLTSVASDEDKKRIAAAFSKADADASGAVTVEELGQLLRMEDEEEREMVMSTFTALDKNGDRVLSVVEFGQLFGKELVKQAGIEIEWKDVEDDASSDEGNT